MADVTTAQRKMFAKMKIAMPDGSYYIRNGSVGESDLENAIKAVGRGEAAGDSGDAIRLHIMARAKALKLTSKIPDTWNSDGSLKHDDSNQEIDAFFEHFGVRGMRWGVRKPGTGEASNHVSEDAAKATELKATVKKHGTSALNNDDLQKLVTRLNLESQHARLNPADVTAGEKFMNELLGIGGNVAKQQATSYANKYTAKGIEKLIKEAAKQQKHRNNNAPLRVVSVR